MTGGSANHAGAATADARVHAAWAELADLTFDLGVPLRPNESPRASALRLADHIAACPEIRASDAEAARAALLRIVEAEELARYAPSAMAGSSTNEKIGRDLQMVARLLRTAAPRTDRARAVLAPRSVVGALGVFGRTARLK